jgi:hypothetical protein
MPIDFPVVIVSGSNPVVTGGNYSYGYHLGLVKPSGEGGPTPITAVLTVNGYEKEHTRSFVEIDTGAKEVLAHAGELYNLQVGDLVEVRVGTDPDAADIDPGLKIATAAGRCTLTLRRAMGLGS